jgi:hypothetical protein
MPGQQNTHIDRNVMSNWYASIARESERMNHSAVTMLDNGAHPSISEIQFTKHTCHGRPPIARLVHSSYDERTNTFSMIYPLLAFNVLVLAAFVFELHQARRERQQLAILIKSRDVAEFVRADRRLAAPPLIDEEQPTPSVELEDADPDAVLASITGDTKS